MSKFSMSYTVMQIAITILWKLILMMITFAHSKHQAALENLLWSNILPSSFS